VVAKVGGVRDISVTAEDTRIVLRTGGINEPIVDHRRQPADYIHPFPDGPIWSWYQEWRVAGGVRLRVYELVVSIVLRRFHDGGLDDSVVDHPGQPADYTHTDGTGLDMEAKMAASRRHPGWRRPG
jgi:hypothetical protein